MSFFFSKNSRSLSKKRQYFRQKYRRKYFKNHNIGPRPPGHSKLICSFFWFSEAKARIDSPSNKEVHVKQRSQVGHFSWL
jgi:hypothetical protein